MPKKSLSGVLRGLGVGGSFRISKVECDRLFPPGMASTEGRAAVYAFANLHGCGIEWDDAGSSLSFVRTPPLFG